MAVVPTVRLFETNAYDTEAAAAIVSNTAEGIRLDRTIFYAESGGQPGDTGKIVLDDGREIEIIDTRYAPGRLTILHIPKEPVEDLRENQPVKLFIDWPRRYAHMQMHTCLHIVCALVDAPVTGCAIHADRGRLDFDLEENTLDKAELTERINKVIESDMTVDVLHKSHEEVRANQSLVRSAMVAPPETGDAMRLIQIPGLDIQPCGGTHVRSTGEISQINVRKIEKKSRKNRRVNIVFES